jgi:hypothetical protein
MAATVPPGGELRLRLDNWGRVLRVYPQLGRAESFEGCYRSPQFEHWEVGSAPKGSLLDVDPDDAWEIEVATRIVAMRYHWLLRLQHVHKASPQSICRQAAARFGWRFYPSELDAKLAMAYALLDDALRLPAAVRKARALEWVRRELSENLTTRHQIRL